MEKISLTSREFLSIYTGVILGEDFSIVLNGLSKYFGDPVTTLAAPRYAKIFKQQINESKPELVNVMKILGKFNRDKDIDIDTQINKYVDQFEQMYGKFVEVNKFHINDLSL